MSIYKKDVLVEEFPAYKIFHIVVKFADLNLAYYGNVCR